MPSFEPQSAFKNSSANGNVPSSSRLKKRQVHQGTLNGNAAANSLNAPNGIVGMSNKIELDPIS